MSNSTGSKEIAHPPITDVLGGVPVHIAFKICAWVDKEIELLMAKLQEEKPKGELKQFGPEDTQELIKSVREVLDEVIYASTTRDGKIDIFDKKEASERIGFAHAAMLDAVYEGAAEWESDCKDAQNQAAALRSENERLNKYILEESFDYADLTKENERLKGERDDYLSILLDMLTNDSIVPTYRIKRILAKYPKPTT